jgi:hypothetical protein
VINAAEVTALFAVPVSTVVHSGGTRVLRRIRLGRLLKMQKVSIGKAFCDAHGRKSNLRPSVPETAPTHTTLDDERLESPANDTRSGDGSDHLRLAA